MASKVTVANIGLNMIGENPITSFGDNTPTARAVNLRYDSVRRIVLRSHPWNSAASREQLAKLTNDPPFGWDHQYQLPNDWLRNIRINDTHTDLLHDRYVIEGEKFLTDMDTVQLIYVRDEEDPNKWDPMLQESIAARLATELAMSISQDRELRNDLWQLYLQKIGEARSANAMDEPAQQIEASEWLHSRLTAPGPDVRGFRPIEDS